MAENTINPKNGIPYYDPFTIQKVDPSVLELQKAPEDKDYYVLYYNMEYEEFKWKKFTGRYDAYFGIKEILDSESIDIRSSIVIVETVAIDPNINKGKRYLNHPDNCSNIIEFCHYVEKFFGENAYNVDEYDIGTVQSEDDQTNEIKPTQSIVSSPFLSPNPDYRILPIDLPNSETRNYITPIIVDDDVETHKI